MNILMDENKIRSSIKRLSYEIIENFSDLDNLILLGIKTRGYTIAKRIAKNISDIKGVQVKTYELDTTTYRDDYDGEKKQISIKENITGSSVVIIDDVLYTGRTIRAALDATIDLGRPQKIRVAVLVDRGHREFPIKADFVGKNIPTSDRDKVKVFLEENDNEDKVII